MCYALLALRSCTMGRMIVIGASKMALFALLTPREDDDVVYVLSGYWSSVACESACICGCVCKGVCVCEGVCAGVLVEA